MFLKRETFFNWNRLYLIVSAIVSLMLPFIKIESFKAVIPKQYTYVLPEIILGNTSSPIAVNNQLLDTANNASINFSWHHILYLGSFIALVIFIYKLYKILLMVYKNPRVKFKNTVVVELTNGKHAFSFFNYIFLGNEIKIEDRATILAHELEHVKEKHTLDLLFFEVLRIVFWFNPLIYMYQKRVANLHEFIADAQAVKLESKVNYCQNLLSQIFDTEKVSFINPFFKQSLIKKRIIMLSKNKSKQIHLVKYALLIPMIIGMLFYTSCEKQTENDIKEDNLEQFSYSVKLGEEMNAEKKAIHKKYEAFLKENKNYVSWSIRNEDTGEMSYSVHEKDEKRPIKMTKHKVQSPDGKYYTTYFNFPEAKKTVHYDPFGAEEISFIDIDQVPIFPGCENLASNDEQRICFGDQIYSLVLSKFNTKLSETLGLEGKQKILTSFTINKEGKIVNVNSRAAHPELEKEVMRVLKLVPQLLPAKQGGKPVSVTFDLPITFKII